ncbi:MAG: hypothetical protein FJ109_16780 [Deltaproteobacteria bacterium]|nr:hypothetical protein [Deltaproteobacteria bacterium]
MFRLKLTLLYLFTIILVVAVIWLIIDQQRDNYVKEEVFSSLKSASKSFPYRTEHGIAQLRLYSESLLASDLPVYISLLSDFREDVRTMSGKTRQAFPNRNAVPPERLLGFVETEGKPILDRFEKEVDARLQKKLKMKGGYASYLRAVMTSCMAEGDPWSVCYFKLTYVPLSSMIFPDQQKELGEAFPELFVPVDENNTARLLFDKLDASIGQLRQDDPDQAAIRYKDHIVENFDQVAEVVKLLRTSSDASISSHMALAGNRVFVTVATRLTSADGKYLGAIIVGYELDKGRAWQDSAVVLGIRPVLEQCIEAAAQANPSQPTSEKLCEYEMGRQPTGLSYVFRNKHGQIVMAGTSLSESSASKLTGFARPHLGSHPTFSSEDFFASVVTLPTDFHSEAEGLYAILSVDIDLAVAMFATMKFILVLLGIVVFLVGLVLLHVLLRSFTRPFEEIDAGVHEIIGGNFDYSFPFAFQDELPRSMAQSLTIMKAVLLGQPLPEDLEQDGSWAENLRIESDVATVADSPGGDSQSPLEEITSDRIKESATEYYRRVYREYLDARKSTGEDVSGITYIKFVEKIARTEKSLRDRFGCKQILFRVEIKDRQVVLVPIRVVEKT